MRARIGIAACIGMFPAAFSGAQPCGFGAELLPFVPAAGWPNGLQGFVRLVNPRPQAAVIAFTAHDDAGNAYDLSVYLRPRETLHFNSADLEAGNVDKGELAGTGAAASGHWRLCFPPGAHAAEPTAYIRTGDGFLTDMTPSVAFAGTWDCAGDGLCPEWRVPIFNPASNENQVSRLRLINNGVVDVPVFVTGYRTDGSWNLDARGKPATVSGTVPASTAVELTAYELETGDGLDAKLETATDADGVPVPFGSLGPAIGKWRLIVRSRGLTDSGELVIVNLMATPTGHLTNLSADHVDAWNRR